MSALQTSLIDDHSFELFIPTLDSEMANCFSSAINYPKRKTRQCDTLYALSLIHLPTSPIQKEKKPLFLSRTRIGKSALVLCLDRASRIYERIHLMHSWMEFTRLFDRVLRTSRFRTFFHASAI